jgi:hypothetical protein
VLFEAFGLGLFSVWVFPFCAGLTVFGTDFQSVMPSQPSLDLRFPLLVCAPVILVFPFLLLSSGYESCAVRIPVPASVGFCAEGPLFDFSAKDSCWPGLGSVFCPQAPPFPPARIFFSVSFRAHQSWFPCCALLLCISDLVLPLGLGLCYAPAILRSGIDFPWCHFSAGVGNGPRCAGQCFLRSGSRFTFSCEARVKFCLQQVDYWSYSWLDLDSLD